MEIVEIVRCKNCIHWFGDSNETKACSCEMDALLRPPGFFCAYGEERIFQLVEQEVNPFYGGVKSEVVLPETFGSESEAEKHAAELLAKRQAESGEYAAAYKYKVVPAKKAPADDSFVEL